MRGIEQTEVFGYEYPKILDMISWVVGQAIWKSQVLEIAHVFQQHAMISLPRYTRVLNLKTLDPSVLCVYMGDICIGDARQAFFCYF